MQKKHIWSAVCSLWLLAALVEAAGTVTVTPASTGIRNTRRYTVAWTSTSGGAVSANTFTLPQGALISVKFVPGTGGSQPTDLYDVTLVDTDGLDYLGGLGANLSNAASSLKQWDPWLIYTGQTLDLVVANAGDTKSGTVEILMEVR